MALFTKPIKTLEDLLTHMLQDIYYAEQQITRALPKMIDKTQDTDLQHVFETHLEDTYGQIVHLEQVFQRLGREPRGASCPAIDGIIKEANEVASDIDDPEVLHAALIGSAQAVEHYEIARYGTIIAIAKQLGHTGVLGTLEGILAQEKDADAKLTEVSKRVNLQSAQA